MVSLVDKFPEWKDFPKGLHVLAVDKDTAFLNHVKSKLQAWDYAVTVFNTADAALPALLDRNNNFHAVLVEAPTEVGLDNFKILEAAKNVPIIMMSDTENMVIMLQSIALGASEFLQKPISDEKLRNIWQHAARKAMSSGKLSETFLPSKTHQGGDLKDVSVVVETKPLSTVNVESATKELEPVSQSSLHDRNCSFGHVSSGDSFLFHDERLSAGPTPRSEQISIISSPSYAYEGPSSSDDSKNALEGVHDAFILADTSNIEDKSEVNEAFHGSSDTFLDAKTQNEGLGYDDFEQIQSELYPDFQLDDQLDLDDNLESLKLSSDLFVDGNVIPELDMDSNILEDMSVPESLNLSIDYLDDTEGQEADVIEEEALLLAEVAKAEKEGMLIGGDMHPTKRLSRIKSSKEDKREKIGDALAYKRDKGSKNTTSAKRKMKVDWTPELHRRFVQAVEQLGVDKAIPSRILELMGVQCLTRHNVASHLQKYRCHKKHVLAREAEASNWNNRRNPDPVTWAKTRTREGANSWPTSAHRSKPLPIQPKPLLAPIQLPPHQHVWGHPAVDHSSMLMWQNTPASVTWQASDGTFWHQSTALLDAWGHPAAVPGTPCYPHPIMRIPFAPMSRVANMAVSVPFGEYDYENMDTTCCKTENENTTVFHPPKEKLDAAISEVLKDPWTPLPLGLKSPSMESVMSELQKQGIPTVPMASS